MRCGVAARIETAHVDLPIKGVSHGRAYSVGGHRGQRRGVPPRVDRLAGEGDGALPDVVPGGGYGVARDEDAQERSIYRVFLAGSAPPVRLASGAAPAQEGAWVPGPNLVPGLPEVQLGLSKTAGPFSGPPQAARKSAGATSRASLHILSPPAPRLGAEALLGRCNRRGIVRVWRGAAAAVRPRGRGAAARERSEPAASAPVPAAPGRRPSAPAALARSRSPCGFRCLRARA